MKTIFTCFTMLLFVSVGEAQKTQGVAAFVTSGYYSLSQSSSVNKVVPATYGYQSNNFFTVGAEAYYRYNKMLFALSGNIGIQNNRSIYKEGIKFSSGTSYASLGWIVLEQKHYWLYPSIGFGIAAIDMNTYDQKNYETEDIQSHIINNASFDVGLNADFILKRSYDAAELSSVLTGLRAGYRFSIQNKTWRNFYGEKLTGLPAYTQNGFYITAAIGCGAFIKGKIFQKGR